MSNSEIVFLAVLIGKQKLSLSLDARPQELTGTGNVCYILVYILGQVSYISYSTLFY